MKGIMSDIATIFRKDPKEWTADDRARVVARYRELQLDPKAFNLKTGERKQRVRRKAKVDSNQINLLDLIAKDAGETS
jgi:hypothetical protein